MNRDGLPRYVELPSLGALGMRSARDVLPPALGTLAFIDPTDVVAAAASCQSGETVPLNLPVDAFKPPLFGRAALSHQILEVGRNEAEDLLDAFNPQSSSQLDGLAHVRAREFGYFNGSTDLESAREALGIHHWAQRGLAGRGVLLDLTAPDPFDGSAIEPADLVAAADAQGVALRPGDALLVRTGWAAEFLHRPDGRGTSAWRGLSAAEDMAEFLWDRRIALVGTDNPAVENSPGSPAAGSLHRRLLPGLGMPLMELLDLERLADRCAAIGRWSFLFVAVPLHVRGAVSSTANAMAIL